MGTSVVTLTVSKILNLAMSMVTAMVLSRYLSTTDYGTYSELQTITSLIVSIFVLGLPNCLNYFLVTFKEDDKGKFLGFYYTAITLISLIIAAAMFFLQKPIAQYYQNPDILLYCFFLTVIPWTKIAISSRSNMLVVQSKIRREFIYSVLNSVCLLLLAAAIVFTSGSFKLYLSLYVLIEAAFSAIVYYEAYAAAGRRLRLHMDLKMIKTVLAFSIPLGLSTAISTLSLDLDKLVIGYFMDETAVAVYANAGKELPFSIISTSFTAVVLPQIVKLVKNNDTKRAIEIWKSSCEICFIILSFCAAACIIFAPQIIQVLYSERYLEGVRIFRIYSLVLLLRITYWGMILNAYGKSKQIFYNSILCLVINIILSVALYHWIGFEGPAIATLISILSMSIVQILHSVRLIGITVGQIFPWKPVAKEGALCVTTALAAWIATELFHIETDTRGIIATVIIGILWAIGYFGLQLGNIKRLWKRING